MTLFEYIAVAASLICSFVAIHLLGSVAAVLRPGARYWVHAVWVFTTLGNLSVQWWLFWSFHDVDWNYGRFVLALSPLALIYVLSSLLIPADAMQVESWRTHFFEVRVRVFGVSLATLVALVLCTVVLLGHPVSHPRRAVPAAMALLFLIGIASDHPRVQEAVVVGFAVLLVVVAVVFARPSQFGVVP